MLTRRFWAWVALVTIPFAVHVPVRAYADPPPSIDVNPGGGNRCGSADCPSSISGDRPGSGGGNGSGAAGRGGSAGSGAAGCTSHGKPVPCQTGDGTYGGDGCYYQPVFAGAPPPPGDHPNGGSWYLQTCIAADGSVTGAGFVFRDTPPAGAAPGLTPAQLAQRAFAKVQLLGAQIGIAPDPNGRGLVGLPVYLWTAVTPNTWGPISASDTDAGLTVTITGRATKIAWNMGNGDTVTCANPGTPYQPSFGTNPSPTCGYRYDQPSRTQPGGRYTVTATTTWQIDWAGGGQSGVIVVTRQSQTTIAVDELQVVT